MGDRIKGAFPGGPSRPGSGEEPARTPHLRRAEEIEAGIARRTLELSKRRRKGRVALGFMLAVLIAGLVGGYVGLESHRTQAELTEAQEVRRAEEVDLSAEVNRTLLQLWKMEDVEAVRNLGRAR